MDLEPEKKGNLEQQAPLPVVVAQQKMQTHQGL